MPLFHSSNDWEDIKRVPRLFRQTITFQLNTIDEDFEQLLQVLKVRMKGLKLLKISAATYHEHILKLLLSCKNIGSSMKDLYNPTLKVKQYANIEVENGNEYNSCLQTWKNIGLYNECIENIDLSIKIDLSYLLLQINKVVDDITIYAGNIKSFIEKRERALFEFDRVRNKIKNLQESNEQLLSTKQTQQLFNYQRHVEERESVYIRLNEILKLELPIFFGMFDQIVLPLGDIVYFVHLNINYQIVDNISKMNKLYRLLETGYANSERYISEFNRKTKSTNDLIEQLGIVKYRDNYFKSVASTTVFCEAIFTFVGETDQDLSIKKGDKIKIIEMNGNWYKGELKGKIGFFPYNYVKVVN